MKALRCVVDDYASLPKMVSLLPVNLNECLELNTHAARVRLSECYQRWVPDGQVERGFTKKT
ncbi:MAG TPA: hypothetical protein VIV66_19940 [Pyrinomonadaceae bacterium]